MRRSEVERLFLIALMVWALCFSVANCGSAKVQSPQSPELKKGESAASSSVTLTHEHPVNSMPVEAEVLSGGSEILEVEITKVVNPASTSVAIFVYLSRATKTKSEAEKNLVGNFSLYPPDRPGKFLLNAGPALHKVAPGDTSSMANDVRLVFEMKRLDETVAWTPVELIIAQPKWRSEK
jgi:hypothetical protein